MYGGRNCQQPPAPNWGTMINENRIALVVNPWCVVVPAALIALLTIGTSTFTDAVARIAIGAERPPEEAALIDGCNKFQAYFRIVLPLVLPALMAVALFAITGAWNEFLLAFVLIQSNAATTGIAHTVRLRPDKNM